MNVRKKGKEGRRDVEEGEKGKEVEERENGRKREERKEPNVCVICLENKYLRDGSESLP